MPSKSKKQHNFMAAVANNPKFAKRADVPQSVGEEFMSADKKYRKGGKAELINPEDWKEDGFPSKRMAEKARDRQMDERMARGSKETRSRKRNKKSIMDDATSVTPDSMGKGDNRKFAKGGRVRGQGCAKKGVKKAKMY